MIFTEEMIQSMKKVEAAREHNISYEPRRMTAEEKENLLAEYQSRRDRLPRGHARW